MEEYKGDAKSYEHAKLIAVTGILATLGIKIHDDYPIKTHQLAFL